MVPSSPKNYHKKRSKKHKNRMRTRQHDTGTRRATTNSERRSLLEEESNVLLKTSKKRKSNKDKEYLSEHKDQNKKKSKIITEQGDENTNVKYKKREKVIDEDSGTSEGLGSESTYSSSDEDDENSNSDDDQEKKEEDNEDNINNESSEKKIRAKASYSSFNDRIKAAILWYVRNELFQKIKIIGDEHLETDGPILRDALVRAEFDKSTDNYHAYIHECRRLIKLTMCARRGYVKRKTGELLRGKPE